MQALSTSSDTLTASADAILRSAPKNSNKGTSDALQVKLTDGRDTTRAIVRFDQAAIAAAAGSGRITAASLEIAVKESGDDPAGNDIDVHRVLKPWTETGVTWACGEDLDPANEEADCPTTGWRMSEPDMDAFAATRTARVHLNPEETGIARLDVTGDVQAFLAGESNHGWLVNAVSTTSRAVFWSRESATGPHLVLTIEAQVAVPPEAPDLIPEWMYSDTNVAASGSESIAAPFTKRIVVVQFQPGATVADREAAVSAVGGSVVGGIKIAGGEGHYYFRIEDVEGATLLSKAAELRAMPQVANAFVNVAGQAQYRRPNDGIGWTRQDWAVLPAALDARRQTWAQTAINAPLAWGCTTGDGSTPIAVVDVDFRVTPTSPNMFQDLQGMSRMTAEGSLKPDGHGAGVAGLLAATGNNGVEMTGVMWDADARLYDYSVRQDLVGTVPGAAFASPIAATVEDAANDGAKVINISSGIPHDPLPVGLGTSRQQAARNTMSLALHGALTAMAKRGRRPLIVLSAGNRAIDASWNGFPLVRSSFPDQILTVGGTTSSGAFWHDGQGSGSNTGIYVDVVAPAKEVYSFVGSGAIEPDNGTSLAAPLVSGIAGLLLSFDPDLTTGQVRKLILDGARRANRAVTHDGGTYYLADAYESLKLAAEKPGTPLCGNRIWSQDDTVYAQRGVTHQRLFAAGGPAAFLNVFHGGRRIDWADRDYAEHSAILTGSGWEEVADRTALADTAPGGTARSMGTQESDFWYSATHDRDKLIRTRIFFLGESLTDVNIQTSIDDGASWTTVHSFTAAGFDQTTFEYSHRRAEFDSTDNSFLRWVYDSMATGLSATASADVRYYPSGSKALIEVRLQQSRRTLLTEFEKCPWASEINGVNTEECRSRRRESEDLETRLYELDLLTGVRTPLLTIPGWAVSGVSEDEEEVILAGLTRRSSHDEIPRTDGAPGYTFTTFSSSASNCHASWYDRQNVSTPAFRVVGANMCTLDHGVGTIAPLVGRTNGLRSLLRPALP